MSVLSELIGNSQAILGVREEVGRLLQRQTSGRSFPPILIQGETGTGKGLLAGAIHRAGNRRDGPFVAVNCAAIPDTLLEAELFGFERGAFTDARQSKPGLVQTAHRGTLFLDEIGLLPGPLQGKLLTVLEERAVRRLGRTRSESVDVAILAATSEDLERAVRERRFSEALYHRLSVLTLRLPLLRERGEDILVLAEHFLARAAAGDSVPPRALTPEGRAALLAYPWPGNVRELSNRMERVTLLAEPGPVTREMLGLPETSPTDTQKAASPPDARQLRERIGNLERESLIEALTATGGNITRAAARLGVPPTSLRYRLRKHGLIVASPGVSPRDPAEATAGPASRPGADPAPITAASPGTLDPRPPAPPPHDTTSDSESSQSGISVATDGGDVPSGRFAAEPERRQLTVMSCGLAGSTESSEQPDSEDWHEVMRVVQTACAEIIRRFDGHVAQYLGDGLLLYFGYPVAHEDDAQRAVRTGLAIVEEMSRLSCRFEQDRGVRLAVRLGIHTGVVVMGEVGAGDERQRLAVGDAPHVAVQLQGLAEADTVVVSPATHRLIEGYFDCHALGARTFSGLARPFDVYRVLQASTAQSRLDVAATAGLTPLVGREQELELLRDRWERAKEGLGQVVLLTGEPGIGKSRLAKALKERIAGEAHAQLEFRCSSYYQNSALSPVIDTLQRQLHFERHDPSPEKLTKLEAAFAAFGFPLEERVPLLASLLSLPLPERYTPLKLAPQAQKQKTLEALLAWLLREAEQQVTLSVWEDLQWVDPSTLEFLSLLIEQVPTMRLLILLTSRPDFRPPWANRSHVTQIALSRLTARQSDTLVHRVARDKPLPVGVLHQLVANTDGVPLFIEESTKMVLESGFLEEKANHYELTAPLPKLAIPSTLHDSLMARLDRLGTSKQIAQLGATLGREFPYELILAVSPVDERTLQRQLGQLVDAELLYTRGLPPQARYSFKHALIQDVAYDSLLKSKRQQYHKQIARALDERFAEIRDSRPELVAHHYTEAGLRQEAVPYWQKAGQRDIEHSANVEAIGHLSIALTLLETMPDTPQRAEQEIALQLALGAPLLMIRGHTAPEAEQAYSRALALCEQVGDSRRHFSALVGLWRVHLSRARLHTAHQLAEQCLTLAQRIQDAAFVQEAHLTLGSTSFYLGELIPALAHLEQGIVPFESQHHSARPLSVGPDPRVACLSWAAWALWMLGYPDQALARSNEALTLAQCMSHPYSVGFALHFASMLHTWRREPQLVRETADVVIALSREHGFVRWLAGGMIRRGWALVEEGFAEEGIVDLREGLATWRAMGGELGLPSSLAQMAEACGRTGQTEEWQRLLAEALDVAHHNGERYYEAELHRLHGDLLLRHMADGGGNNASSLHLSPPEVPISSLHRAIAVARHQHAKSLELRAALSLSRLWQRQGKTQQAYDMLAHTYGWFTEGFGTPDLREAHALLEALASALA